MFIPMMLATMTQGVTPIYHAIGLLILLACSSPLAGQQNELPATLGETTWQIERADAAGEFESSYALRQQRLGLVTNEEIQQSYFQAELKLFEQVRKADESERQQLANLIQLIQEFRRHGCRRLPADAGEITRLNETAKRLLTAGHPIRVGLETMQAALLLQQNRVDAAYDVLQRARRDCAQAFGCPSLAETLPRFLLVKLNRPGDHAILATELQSIALNIEGLIGVDHPWFVQVFAFHQLTTIKPFSEETLNRIDAMKFAWTRKNGRNSPESLLLMTAQTRALAASDPEAGDNLGNLTKELIAQNEGAGSMSYADIQLAHAENYMELKLVDSARENLEQAIEFLQQVGPIERIRLARAKRMLGKLELMSENDQVALSHYQSAYETFTGNAPDHTILLAKYSVPIADDFVSLGYVDLAINVYQRALVFEIFNAQDNRTIELLMDRLALSFGAMYQPLVAHEAWRTSLENGFATLNRAMASGDLDAAVAKSDQLAFIVRDFVSLTDPSDPAQTIMAFEYATRVKGLAMRMMAASEEIRANAENESIQTPLARFDEGLETLARTAFRSRLNIVRENEIQILQTQQQERLTGIASLFAEKTQSVIGAGSVSDAIITHLPEDHSIIEIVPATNIGNPKLSDYVAFVVSKPIGTQQFNIAMERLDETGTIDDIVRQWREQIASTERVERHVIEPLGLDVREALWKPMARHLGSTRNIIICAPGELARMPWAAIPRINNNPQTRSTPIWLIAILLVLAFVMLALARIRAESSKRYVVLGLAIAAAVWGGWRWFNAPRAEDRFLISDYNFIVCSDSPTLMTRAGNSAERQDHVTLLALDANTRSTNRTQEINLAKSYAGAQTLIDSNASGNTVLKQLAATRGGLHLIANGGDGDSYETSTWPVQSSIELINDQHIGGEELVHQSMQDIDWALLSTLDSEHGNAGLQQVFFLGGVRSVIGHLWAPTDQSTFRFAKRFYRNLERQELTLSETVRQTQLQMIRRSDPTCDWATWNVYGDYR